MMPIVYSFDELRYGYGWFWFAWSNSKDRMVRTKGPSPYATTLFVGLRTLDVVLQYWLLYIVKPEDAAEAVQGGALSLQTILFAMALAAAVKQILWATLISEQQMTPDLAVRLAATATFFNSANCVLSPSHGMSQAYGSHPVRVGLGLSLYVTGLSIELLSETQRAVFKRRRKNTYYPYSKGLFSLARNINYSGHTLWRTGYALAGGGWIWGYLVWVYFTWDFMRRAIPVLEAHCKRTYGQRWREMEDEVPYVMVPGFM